MSVRPRAYYTHLQQNRAKTITRMLHSLSHSNMYLYNIGTIDTVMLKTSGQFQFLQGRRINIRAVLLTDKYCRQRVLCGESYTFEKIWLRSGPITTVCHCNRGSFAQLAGKCDACCMENLRRNWRSTCNHIVLLIAPVMHYLTPSMALFFDPYRFAFTSLSMMGQ